jgi:tetratricopeptide (TPR) repeat protein
MSSAIAFQEALRIARKALEESADHERLAILRALLYSFQGEQYDGESRALLDQLARMLIAQGEFSEARKVAVRLGAVDADAAALFEHRIEFEMRRREADANDPLSIYRLGCWAAERGLMEEARTMLRQAAKAPELRENAELQLQAMQLAVERQEFDRLVAAFEARDFPTTIKKAATFRQMYPSSSLLQRVRTMEEVSRFQLERQARLAPQQADALYQNAERLYYQGRYRDAVEILNRLDTDFAETPATRRGAHLRAAILRREPNLSAIVSSTTGTQVSGPPAVRAAVSRAAYLGEVTSLLLQMSEAQASQP